MIKNEIWEVFKYENGFYIKKANLKLFNNYIKKAKSLVSFILFIGEQKMVGKIYNKFKKYQKENIERSILI